MSVQDIDIPSQRSTEKGDFDTKKLLSILQSGYNIRCSGSHDNASREIRNGIEKDGRDSISLPASILHIIEILSPTPATTNTGPNQWLAVFLGKLYDALDDSTLLAEVRKRFQDVVDAGNRFTGGADFEQRLCGKFFDDFSVYIVESSKSLGTGVEKSYVLGRTTPRARAINNANSEWSSKATGMRKQGPEKFLAKDMNNNLLHVPGDAVTDLKLAEKFLTVVVRIGEQDFDDLS